MSKQIAVDQKYKELIEAVLEWYEHYDTEKDASDNSRHEWAALEMVRHRMQCADLQEDNVDVPILLKDAEVYYLSMTVHYARNDAEEAGFEQESLRELYNYLCDIRKKGGVRQDV